MSRRIIALARLLAGVAITLAVVAADASAQEINFATTSTERPHQLGVRTGLDHGFIAELGYRRVVALPDRHLVAGVELAMPWAEPDLSDFRLSAGAAVPIVGRHRWKLTGRLGPTVRGTNTVVGRMTSLGADLRIAGGYHAPRWFAAGELGVDWAATTHIGHSDAYRATVYAEARDGWYRNTGGTVYAGVHGGVSLSSVDLVLRVGRPMAIDLSSQTIPVYITLGANLAL